MQTMEKQYHPQYVESKWYDWWESQGYFKPKENGKAFTVLLPPPNLTGTLHLGHLLTITIQDAYLRWMRMKGENVLWIPGFDHAGIATQSVVEKTLHAKLNLSKFDLGRDQFVNKIDEWKDEKKKLIIQQMRLTGASVDWSRMYYTLDNKHTDAVTKAFLHLYNKNLIYRCLTPVNWSSSLQSSVSDADIDWKELETPTNIRVPGYENPVSFGYMYIFSFKLYGEDKHVLVGTTRPETIIGDTAVAFNPNDSRYVDLRGKFIWHPIRKKKIPIVFDERVNPLEGTGGLKITPGHSSEDYEIAKTHNLEVLEIFDNNGRVRECKEFAQFAGMKCFDLRTAVIKNLNTMSLYKGKIPYKVKVPFCSRSGCILECMLKPQWLLKCDRMVENVAAAISNNEIKIEPAYCISILNNWFKNLKDWTLSRQIWWGQQIPMYECEVGNEKIWIGATSPTEARLLASKKLEADPNNIKITRDPDVLDTWFSSGILPFAVNGWPNKLSPTYPLGLMETGCDIVFFWVARMLMLGLEITGRFPFNHVVLHGMIRDSKGRKMSKSLGNVISPEHVIKGISLPELLNELEKSLSEGTISKDEYKISRKERMKMFPSGIEGIGTDALRIGLCSSKIKAENINFDLVLIKSYRNFCNKMWQSVIFLKLNMKNESDFTAKIDEKKLSLLDKWILGRLANAVILVNEGISSFNYYVAIEAMKLFFMNELCAIYLESIKPILKGSSKEDSRRVIAILFNCYETFFRLISPFMPFVTEELYQCLPKVRDFTPSESVTIADFPDPKFWIHHNNPQIHDQIMILNEIITMIRQCQVEYKLKNQNLKVVINCDDELNYIFTDELKAFLFKQTRVNEFSRVDGDISEDNAIVKTTENVKIYIYH